MATKTFKIGEYCKGGIITVIISPFGTINVIGKEWDHSKGTRRSSDQTNAKEFTSKTFDPNLNSCMRDLQMYLNDLTTSYYTDQVIKWIESKVKIKPLW